MTQYTLITPEYNLATAEQAVLEGALATLRVLASSGVISFAPTVFPKVRKPRSDRVPDAERLRRTVASHGVQRVYKALLEHAPHGWALVKNIAGKVERSQMTVRANLAVLKHAGLAESRITKERPNGGAPLVEWRAAPVQVDA